MGGLERYEADDGENDAGWCDWYDEETGEDDPQRYSEERQPVTAD